MSKIIYNIKVKTPHKIQNRYNKTKGYDFVPFVYLIKCIPTGMVYYGSRFSNNAHPDLMCIDYFTSSKVMHELFLAYGFENFVFQIRKTFKTKDACIKWEGKVLRRMKVKNHPLFINIDDSLKCADNNGLIFISNPQTNKCIRVKKSLPLPEGWVYGNINFKSESVKERLWFHDKETGKAFHVNPNEAKEDWLPGRGPNYISNSEIMKSKNLIFITNGIDNKQINKDSEVPDGWRKGRTRTQKEIENSNIANKKRIGNYFICNENGDIKQIAPDDLIPEGWIKGMSYNKNKKEYVNIKTGEFIFSNIKPGKEYISISKYKKLKKDQEKKLNTLMRYYINGNVFYSLLKDIPDNVFYEKISDGCTKGKITITNGIITIWHPINYSIPLGWEQGNCKLKGKIPPNKNEDRTKYLKEYTNTITGEVIIAEKNPDKKIWTTENSGYFKKGNDAPNKGRICYVDITTGKFRFLKPDSEVPENFILHIRKK